MTPRSPWSSRSPNPKGRFRQVQSTKHVTFAAPTAPHRRAPTPHEPSPGARFDRLNQCADATTPLVELVETRPASLARRIRQLKLHFAGPPLRITFLPPPPVHSPSINVLGCASLVPVSRETVTLSAIVQPLPHGAGGLPTRQDDTIVPKYTESGPECR